MDGGEGEFHNQLYDLFHMPLRDHASHIFDTYHSYGHLNISIDTCKNLNLEYVKRVC